MRQSKEGSSPRKADCGVDRVISDLVDPLKQDFSAMRSRLVNNTVTTAKGSNTDSADGSYRISDILQIPSSQEIVMPSISGRIESAIAEYFTAITVGAVLGAAVATGVGLGMVAATNLISTGKYLPTLYRWVFRTRRQTEQNTLNMDQEDERDAQDKTNHEADVSLVGSGENCIAILRGKVRNLHIPISSAFDQCQECLDHVGVLLGKQSLGWINVRRLTAYLVDERCDAKTFRNSLKDYPLPNDNVIISILYVQRLESAHASVQLEVLASKT